jgi:hypothetical protein
VGFEELICAITRSAVVMLGCDIASNSAFSWKNLAWIVVICQLVSNIHRPAVLSDGGGNNTPSTSGGRERGRLESRSHEKVGRRRVQRQEPALLCRASHAPLSARGICLPES